MIALHRVVAIHNEGVYCVCRFGAAGHSSGVLQGEREPKPWGLHHQARGGRRDGDRLPHLLQGLEGPCE